jgi:hypothetical protein
MLPGDCGPGGRNVTPERAIWRGMTMLPPEDQPDAIDIGPVRGIPIIDPDDPRFEGERRAWSQARAKAQAMHSADELLQGLCDDDWMVRFEVVDRLIARARDDERTVPALLAAADDSVPAVRETVVMRLCHFSDGRAVSAIVAPYRMMTQRCRARPSTPSDRSTANAISAVRRSPLQSKSIHRARRCRQ